MGTKRQAGGDRRQAAAGRDRDGAGQVDCGGGAVDRRERADLLPLASRVRQHEDRSGEAVEGAGDGEHSASAGGIGPDLGQAHPDRSRTGKLLSPARRRSCVDKVKAELGVSERRACQVLGQHRSTQRKPPRTPDDEAQLTADIIELAKQYGRYGYRRITALLRSAGWAVNAKRVQRIWRREGLKVPQKQPKRGRLWLNDGSCVRLRAS